MLWCMSDVLKLQLSEDEQQRLNRAAELSGQSPASYVREALRKYLDEWDYVATIRAEVEAIHKGELKATSLEELEREMFMP